MSARPVRVSRREKAEVNRRNAHGKPWNGIDPDHIVKCYDMYKRGQLTSRQLFDHFPGRTLKAIESKVWKIRGRAEHGEHDDPNQEDMFRKQLGA